MNVTIYNRALLVFFTVTALVWLSWGTVCLFRPQAWSGQVIPGLTVFDLSRAVSRIEVAAMYGGLQIAIGLLAAIAVFTPKHRETTLLFFVLAFSGLAMSRIYGLFLENSKEILLFRSSITSETYNQIGLGMYECPSFLFAWALFLTKPNSKQ